MNFNHLLLEQQDKLLVVKINSPSTLNALNVEILTELDELFNSLSNDQTVSVIIITGIGKAFIAGADISEMKNMNFDSAKEFGKFGSLVFNKIEQSDKIVIAAINGYALGGGCELAMACDIRIACHNAKFAQPEVGLGITPGFSGTIRLPKIVGIGKAKELILTGDIINAEEAYRIGLVDKLVENDKLIDECILIADKISSKAPIALNLAKQSINSCFDKRIEDAMNVENELFAKCFDTEDQKEGMEAFLEKRKPVFNNH